MREEVNMVKKLPFFTWFSLLLLSVLLLASGCNADSEDESSLPDINGPALIMFYTNG